MVRRMLLIVLLPLWLMTGWAGMTQPAHAAGSRTEKKKPSTETKISKVEAAQPGVHQIQAPQADLWTPDLVEPSYSGLPADQEEQPLRAGGGRRPVPGFGHRYYRTTISLRAP